LVVMDPQPLPSYEDLLVLVGVQAGRIGELEELVGRLVAENEELRRRVGAGSSSSSPPPSSDSLYDRPTPKPRGCGAAQGVGRVGSRMSRG